MRMAGRGEKYVEPWQVTDRLSKRNNVWVTNKHMEKSLSCASSATTQSSLMLSTLALTRHQQCSLSGHKSHADLYLTDAFPISTTIWMGWVSEGTEEKQHHMCTENQEGSENVSDLRRVETALRGDVQLQRARGNDLVKGRQFSPILNHLPCHPAGAGQAWVSLTLEKSCNFLGDPS